MFSVYHWGFSTSMFQCQRLPGGGYSKILLCCPPGLGWDTENLECCPIPCPDNTNTGCPVIKPIGNSTENHSSKTV